MVINALCIEKSVTIVPSDPANPTKGILDYNNATNQNYAGFCLIAIKAIQEQQKNIENLKDEMKKLKTTIVLIQQKIN